MDLFTIEHTPADIVKTYPKASDLFKVYQIDFCCGGDQPLKQVFSKNETLEETAVLNELNAAYQDWQKQGHEVIDWDVVPLSELVDHIVHTHHAYLYKELPALAEFVTKIFRVHGPDQPQLKELYYVYNQFQSEMIEHTIKEDNEVFPLIKEYEKKPSEGLLQRIREANGELENEHDIAGDLLKKMRNITNGFTLPANACGSYQITYARLAEMEENTFQHVHLENNVLFTQL